jgi:hypothetical protein
MQTRVTEWFDFHQKKKEKKEMFPAATLWRKGNHVNVSRDQSALAKGEKPILEIYINVY